jgi:PAS domain S-box-containing protein
MSEHSKDPRTKTQLLQEVEELRFRLEEAEETLEAIRHAEVDALVVAGPQGEQIFSITGAEHIYRVIVETVNEAALTVDPDGTILFCNRRFCDLMKTPIQGAMGHKVTAFVARPQLAPLKTFLAAAQAGPVQRRLTLRAADGSTVPVQLAASPLQTGDRTSICLVASDLTELEASAQSIRVLREHRQALEESEARFRTMFEASQDAIVITDDEGVYVQANPAVAALFGLPPEQLLGRKASEFLDDTLDFPAFWQAFLTNGSFHDELGLIDAQGQQHDVDFSAVTSILPGRHMAVIRDITERKQTQRALEGMNERLQTQAEELEEQTEELRVQTEELFAANTALRQSEERLRLAQQAGRVGVFDRDLQNNTVVWTPELEELFGLPAGTFVGKTGDWAKWVHPEDLPRMRSFLQEWMQSERTEGAWEYRFVRADGQIRWMEGRGRIFRDPDGKPLRLIGTNVDITERKRAEEQLQEAHRRLNLHIDTSPLAVVEWDNDFHITRWAGEAADIFGWTSEEVLGKHIDDLPWVYEEDWPAVKQVMEDMISGRRPRNVSKNRNVRKDGTIIYCEWYNSAISDASGRLVSVLSQVLDVTERKQAEEALRESEERYHRLFEEDLTGDFVSTPEGRILLCNPAFAKIFGFPSAVDAVGTNMLDLYLDPQQRELLVARLRQEKRIERLEVWRKRREGESIYIVENLVGHFNERGELYEVKGYVFDDTERKRAEEALRELNTTLESKVAQRTAELQHRARQLQKLTLELSETEERERRQLAEVLHDDLQQQLAAAKFHLSLLNSRAKHDPSQRALVAQVDQMLVEAIQKSRNLSHELSPTVLYHADFAGALNWLAGQVHAKHGLEVAVEPFGAVSVQSDALKTFLYKAAQELLFNVVKHARVNKARIRVRRLGRCICLSVSDRGRGFEPQELRQTPGFGLLSIRERIELLGGRMKIHSVKGQGTTFHIVVPDAEEVVGSRTSVVREEKGPADHRLPATDYRQPLRVLLADDHEIVREGLRSLLSDQPDVEVVGEAANGREAVDQAYRLQPDVIIMDVAMPLINGDDATRQIKVHLPQTRVIALSMYEEPDMVDKMRRAGAEDYILKTAPSEKLVAAIRGQAHAEATA